MTAFSSLRARQFAPTAFPLLHLLPLDGTFPPKWLALGQGRVTIGRSFDGGDKESKEQNGLFDSRVLSRSHAAVWEENGKIMIQDTRSANGTYLNSERLSPEGVESAVFELNSGDLVQFGIDVFSEDRRTIYHHKVTAKVFCVLGPNDVGHVSSLEN